VERTLNSPLQPRRLVIVGVLLIAIWAPLTSPFLEGASFLAIPIWLASLILAVRWRRYWPLLPIILNPLVLGFGVGVHEWFRDRPTLSYMGLPGTEFFNLDPATRCYRSTGGCIVSGDEWMTQFPHNAGLRFMTTLFGAPGGTYHGPYPTKEEAVLVTETASETPANLFLQGKVLVSGKEIALGTEKVRTLLQDFGMIFFDANWDDIHRRVRAQVFQERCLVLRVGTKEVRPNGSVLDESEGIVLFDLDGLRPFALYVLSGHAGRQPRLLMN
jgi:hypothetical protein